ncbi:MAG: hypothetical protein LRY27_03850 [Chitinophagales bacterium]|nr:hypothetical protein [Chitinophagales bacterium]
MVSKQIAYAQKHQADYNYEILGKEKVAILYNGKQIDSHLVGHYNGLNMGAALAVGLYFDVALPDIKNALEHYVPDNNRSEWRTLGSNKILLDAYNANPTSMKAALESFSALENPNKIVFLGDMFEVGADSAKEHKAIIDLCTTLHFKQCVFVGKDFYAYKNTQYIFFQTTAEAKAWFDAQDFENAFILIKGSRGMKMEGIISDS